jgi:FKBP-type peptidyl-prolyl cis-trans isomerase
MPPSKQARAAQERQKDRLAMEHARQAARRKRMRWVGGIVTLVVFVLAVGVVLVIANNNTTSKVKVTTAPTTAADAPTSSPTTAAAAAGDAAGKPCVALKGTLPKGAPNVPILPGKPPTTLVKNDIKVGSGATVPEGAKKVTVNYIGVSCSTGEIFDSSWSRSQTFDADLSGGVIPGWQQGIPGMKVGGERELVIPPSLGYGAAGSPPTIAPNETLIFVVDVVSV